MLQKLFLLAFTATLLIACDGDKDDNTGLPAGYVYASSNSAIADGSLIGKNMFFYGSTESTDAAGNRFADRNANFEIAGGHEQLVVYMHATRFVAAMPGVEMRIPDLGYTGQGNSVSFEVPSVVPEANISGMGYKPVERYTITDLKGSIDGTLCRIRFTCIGHDVQFEGKLIVKK